MLENDTSWFLWTLCSNYGRGAGEGIHPIQINNVCVICELYDATIEDFEKVLWIEEHAYPILVEQYTKKLKEQTESARSKDRDKY